MIPLAGHPDFEPSPPAERGTIASINRLLDEHRRHNRRDKACIYNKRWRDNNRAIARRSSRDCHRRKRAKARGFNSWEEYQASKPSRTPQQTRREYYIKHRDKIRAKNRAQYKAIMADPVALELHRERGREYQLKCRERKAEAEVEREKRREKNRVYSRTYRARRKDDPAYQAEAKRKRAEYHRRKMQDPEYREKVRVRSREYKRRKKAADGV